MTRRDNLKKLTDNKLETEFLTTRFWLLEIDAKQTTRLRKSKRLASSTHSPGNRKEYLGVWDYKDCNQLAIGDKVYLQTKSGSTTSFAGIEEAIVFGLDNRGFVKIHKIGNTNQPENHQIQLRNHKDARSTTTTNETLLTPTTNVVLIL